jgi:glycosyltransferase involved in cell wall biosynthesis
MFEVAFAAAGLILLFVFFLAARRETTVYGALHELDNVVEQHAIEQFGLNGGFKQIKRITLVMPALNEKESLEQLLPRVPKSVSGEPLGLLIVDDGSSDGTADLARSFGFGVVSTPAQRGQGAALRLGYRIALMGESEILVIMDADGQNRPEEIEGLIEPILADRADYVIGSRMLGHFEKDDGVRLMGVRLLSPLVSLLTGTKITDCSSGFKAMKTKVLANVIGRLKQRQYACSELNIEVARSGFRIREVPITFLKRIRGTSKKGNNLYYAFAFTRVIFSTWFRTLLVQKHSQSIEPGKVV